MAVGGVDVREQAREMIAERKAQILEKVKHGETEPSIAIGSSSFTEKEWDKLMNRIDKTLENTKEEQEERFSKKKEQWEEQREEEKSLQEKRLMEELFERENAESKRKAAKLMEK